MEVQGKSALAGAVRLSIHTVLPKNRHNARCGVCDEENNRRVAN